LADPIDYRKLIAPADVVPPPEAFLVIREGKPTWIAPSDLTAEDWAAADGIPLEDAARKLLIFREAGRMSAVRPRCIRQRLG
jgi:hypothetical protein